MKKLLISLSEKFFDETMNRFDIAHELMLLQRQLESKFNTSVRIKAYDKLSNQIITVKEWTMKLIIPNSKNADYFEMYFRGYMPHKIWVSRPDGDGADFPADEINDVLYNAIKKYFDKNM